MSLAKAIKLLILLIACVLCIPRIAPEALAFPYSVQFDGLTVHSERPMAMSKIQKIIADGNTRLKQSEIYQPPDGTRIFLTTGGWRWRLLSLNKHGAFAFSLPINDIIVVNDSDIANNIVQNRSTRFGKRSLTSIIAHERTHGLIRKHFGMLADVQYPSWLREGYCDFVAGESTLNDAQAQALLRAGKTIPALDYYLGHQSVARELENQSVDQLFAKYKAHLHKPPHTRLIPGPA